jgi:hypothetical protein
VVGLDASNINIWFNPTPPQSPGLVYQPDYIIDYYGILGEMCTIVTLVNSTLDSTAAILSCNSSYYYVSILYNSTPSLTIITIFTKYPDCDELNKFKPVFNSNLSILAVECQQNIDTIRLEEF